MGPLRCIAQRRGFTLSTQRGISTDCCTEQTYINNAVSALDAAKLALSNLSKLCTDFKSAPLSGQMVVSSVQKHGSLRLLLLSFFLLVLPLLLLLLLLAGAQNRARELAALTPEGVHSALATDSYRSTWAAHTLGINSIIDTGVFVPTLMVRTRSRHSRKRRRRQSIPLRSTMRHITCVMNSE